MTTRAKTPTQVFQLPVQGSISRISSNLLEILLKQFLHCLQRRALLPTWKQKQNSWHFPITFSSVFSVYHFTVIIWCFLTEGNRPLQQKLSLDGNPKPIHGTPERSDGLQWSAEQPCNPSKPKAKTSPVKSNTPAAHLEIKPDELAKKRGKVISFAQMIQHILHPQRSARMLEHSKRMQLSEKRCTCNCISLGDPHRLKSRCDSSHVNQRSRMFTRNHLSFLCPCGHSALHRHAQTGTTSAFYPRVS